MLCVLSPAKRLNLKEWKANTPNLSASLWSHPIWTKDVENLVDILKKLDCEDYQELMHISEKQARQVRDYYDAFAFPHTPDHAKPACFMFSGDTYVGLDAPSLSMPDLTYAKDHISIISGLYGLLRPTDLVCPFRLDMGTKLNTPKGKNLYTYWGDKICDALIEKMNAIDTKVLVNLASVEYFKAAQKDKLIAHGIRIITPSFKEIRDNGEIKVMSLFAKRARGSMARWIVENKATDPKDLKNFNSNGYTFQPGASQGDDWTFVRPQPPKKSIGAEQKKSRAAHALNRRRPRE